MSTVKKNVLCLLICCGLFACNINDLDFDNLEIQPVSGTFAVPLGSSTYSIRDLLDGQNDSIAGLLEDSTSLLLLYYTDSILYNAQDDFVDIEDIVGSDTLDISDIPPVSGPLSFSFVRAFSESYNSQREEELDSVYYSQGELALTVTSNSVATLNYSITFENTITQDTRQPVVFTGTVNGQGSDNPPAQDLAGYFTRLIGDQNLFSLTFDAEFILADGQAFTGNEVISYEFTYRNQDFDLIYGKLGQDSITVGNEAINIDFFDDSGDDGFFLGNPVFRFTFDNTFGLPVATDFSGIRSEDENGTQNALDGDIIGPTSLPIIEASENPGEVRQSIIEINRSNSNINQMLANSPSRLVFEVTAISNYYDAAASNFVQPDNEIDGLIEVEIPLELSLKDYQQSFAFNLNGGLDTQDVDSAFLRIVTLNELPFSGSLSMEIQDSTDAPVYSIPDVLVFAAPFINVNGFVIDPSGASADVSLPPEAIDALANGDRIEMTVTLNTPVSQTSRDIFVKILADYTLEIKIGLGGRYNYEF